MRMDPTRPWRVPRGPSDGGDPTGVEERRGRGGGRDCGCENDCENDAGARGWD